MTPNCFHDSPGRAVRLVATVAICLGVVAWAARGWAAPTPDGVVAVDSPATAGLTFVTVTIHGQVAAAFAAEDPSTVVAPDWIHSVQTKLDGMATQINDLRSSAGLPLIEHVGVEGDWANLTWYGARYVLTGRVLQIVSSSSYLDSNLSNLADVTGRLFANLGRLQTGDMSRFAARRIEDVTLRQIETRLADHPDVPIYIDVIGHSRGGAVSAELIRRLYAALQGITSGASVAAVVPPLPPMPALSVTYLEGIDPTPSGLSTLAGNLLEDPIISRAGPERISNFYAEKGYDASIDGSSFFGSGFADWIAQFGGSLTDQDLVDLGYPHGRSRPELFPNPQPFPDINEMIPNSTHLSIESDFTAMSDVNVGQAPTSDFSLSTTTFLGEAIQNPLFSLPLSTAGANGGWSTADLVYADPPAVGETSGSGRVTAALDTPLELVRDSNFSQSATIVANASVLIGSSVIKLLIPDSVGGILTLLQQISDNSFPFDGVWDRAGTGTTIADLSGVPGAQLVNGDSLSQDLSVQSMDYGRFLTTVDYEFTQSTGDLTASLAGDRLQVFDSIFASDVGTGARHTLQFYARRRFVPPTSVLLDSVNLVGSDVNVYSVSVVPRPLSIDVTGYILARPAPLPDTWDVNEDGTVDVADVIQAARFGI